MKKVLIHSSKTKKLKSHITHHKSNNSGITLVALIITIIVLLILAVVAIRAVQGDGIISKAKEASEKTKMAQLKEEAELVKSQMYIEYLTDTKNSERLEKAKLLLGLNNHFVGSTRYSDKIVTGDGKYDIKVLDDLEIIVMKHLEDTLKDGELQLTCVYDGIVTIYVTPIIGGYKTYDEYAKEILANATPEQKKQMLIEGEIYWYPEEFETIENPTLEYVLEQNGASSIEELCDGYDSFDDLLISWEYVKPEEYYNKFGDTDGSVEITCSNGNTINTYSGETVTFKTTENGTYIFDATAYNGNTAKETIEIKNINIILIDEVKGTILSETENTDVYDKYGNKVVVPAGFKITTDASKVKEGIVIQDESGNEFVWIPVTELNTSGCNEPAVVTGDGSQYDAVEDNLKNAGCADLNNNGKLDADDFNRQLTNEFNSMRASVNKYQGFYVGRYETSLKGTTAQSKAGELPMNNIDWYAMYKNSKTYAPENSSKSVVSQMIWRSQWNAMIDYIETTADASHATATNNVGHVRSDFTIKPYKTGGTNYTEAYKGSTAYNDKAANIYDLEGNVMEYTQGMYNNEDRVCIGGDFASSFSPNSTVGVRPDDGALALGSRLALYIK